MCHLLDFDIGKSCNWVIENLDLITQITRFLNYQITQFLSAVALDRIIFAQGMAFPILRHQQSA